MLSDCFELITGCVFFRYTAFSELLPLLAVGATPFLKVKKISQVIDSKTQEIVNATTVSSPFATFSFSATAYFEIQTSSRIQVSSTRSKVISYALLSERTSNSLFPGFSFF